MKNKFRKLHTYLNMWFEKMPSSIKTINFKSLDIEDKFIFFEKHQDDYSDFAPFETELLNSVSINIKL